MKKILKLFLKYQLKLPAKRGRESGFTLIELLVAIIISGLVLLPLLGFMINIMETDRKEQAKHASEQEINTALNYISRDLDQAVFIYDGLGIDQIRPNLPTNLTNGNPVLVFWKRKFLEKALPIKDGNVSDCNPNDSIATRTGRCDDAFVYSLVAYYLITEPANCTNTGWSCTARIARYEFQDQLLDENNPNQNNPLQPPATVIPRSPGFALFNLSPDETNLAAASLEVKMNAWPNPPATNPIQGSLNDPQNKVEVLIDYIDQTPPRNEPQPERNPPVAQCPTDARPLPRPDLPPTATDADAQATPYTYRLAATPTKNSGFYACVDTDKTTAQVFIRGNARSRIQPKGDPLTYDSRASVPFPSSNIIVQGRGLINDASTNQ